MNVRSCNAVNFGFNWPKRGGNSKQSTNISSSPYCSTSRSAMDGAPLEDDEDKIRENCRRLGIAYVPPIDWESKCPPGVTFSAMDGPPLEKKSDYYKRYVRQYNPPGTVERIEREHRAKYGVCINGQKREKMEEEVRKTLAENLSDKVDDPETLDAIVKSIIDIIG